MRTSLSTVLTAAFLAIMLFFVFGRFMDPYIAAVVAVMFGGSMAAILQPDRQDDDCE